MPRPPTTLFEDAIDVPMWLEADRRTPLADRVRRDRDAARRVTASSRLQSVRDWWRVVGREQPVGDGARLARLRRLVTLGMAALGAAAGVTVALAAFHYDGSQPVNVVRLLALLVGAQLLLLALTLLLLLGRAAGLRSFQDLLATITPGGWAASVFRRLAGAAPEASRLLDWHSARASAGRFAKWQILYWSQVAAVAFNFAVIVTAIVLVTFTDLAFGWSTTLDADSGAVSRIVQIIAWPWHALVPSAVPSAALVEQSQFFRLEGGSLPGGASRALTGWWPFTILSVVTYGLLPRVALLVLAAARLRVATAALLLDDPRVTALLDRMAAPAIETAAAEHEGAPAPGAGAAPAPRGGIAGRANAVIWDGSLAPEAARAYARERLGLDLGAVVEAGGSRALLADRAALEQASDGARSLVVFTPAWEPPLLELLDFLAALRGQVGSAASIVVAPVPDGARDVSDLERETWTRAVGRMADPRLYVEIGAA
jgi:uncharacterized protein DUF2868